MNVMKLEKKNVGNSELRLENYCICKFIWNIVNVSCTRHQIKYVCMYVWGRGVEEYSHRGVEV